MKTKDVMTCPVVAVGLDTTVHDIADTLLEKKVSAVPVLNDTGKLVGMISERDLVRVIANGDNDIAKMPVGDLMTRNVITCGANMSAVDAMALMKSNRIRHMPVSEGEELVGMISIRDLMQVCEQLQTEASIDGLTGISNRRHFLEILEKELERSGRFGHPISVAMIDIDNFKRVNDTYGHDAGDKVLSALAKLFVQELRTIDRVGR